jgi:hypothetical protein
MLPKGRLNEGSVLPFARLKMCSKLLLELVDSAYIEGAGVDGAVVAVLVVVYDDIAME